MIDVAITLIGFSIILFTGFIIFERRLYSMVDSIGDIFSEILTQPVVKGAFSNMGSISGEKRGQNAMAEKLATDILNGPKFGALKMGASALGINIEEYIEENGAMNTITGLQSIAGALGININDVISGGLSQLGPEQQTGGTDNPYI